MKIAAVRAGVAIALLLIGAAFWAEARLTRRVADIGSSFITFRQIDDRVDEEASMLTRLLWRFGRLREEAGRLRVRMAYWRALPADTTASLTPAAAAETTASADTSDTADPEAQFAAANTAFREALRFSGDRAVLTERLDKVLQAYAEVMRADAVNTNASYNYELAARYRDAVARGSGPVRPQLTPDGGEPGPGNLPPGPTIHGRPGANQTELRAAGGGSSDRLERPLVDPQPDADQRRAVDATSASASAAERATVPDAPPSTASSTSAAFSTPAAPAPSSIPDTRRGSVTVSASSVTPSTPPSPAAAPSPATQPAADSPAIPGAPRVFFIAPKNGQTFLPYQIGTFEEPVVFTFGVANFRIAAVPDRVAQARPDVGHYHFGVETGCLPAGAVIPRSDTWVHLDAAETRYEMVLDRPGDRTFTVQLGDDEHRALPGLCATITVKVLPY